MNFCFSQFILSRNSASQALNRNPRTSLVLSVLGLLIIVSSANPAHGQTLTCAVASSTQHSNIRLCTPRPAGKSHAVLIDFDSDGDLDIVTVGLVGQEDAKSDFPYYPDPPPSPMKAYRNNGDFSFTEVTAAVLADESIQIYQSGELEVADMTGDGLDDLYIADYGLDFRLDGIIIPGGQNRLLVQSASGQLLDETTARLPAILDKTHGYDIGDINGDGHPDIMAGNIFIDFFGDTDHVPCGEGAFAKDAPCPNFSVNQGNGIYESDLNRLPYEVTTLGFASGLNSRAPVLADIDNDGDLDLILAREYGPIALLNNGRGYFYFSPAAMPPIAGPSTTDRFDPNGATFPFIQISTKFVAADLNLDGWVDILSGIGTVPNELVDEPYPAVQMFLNNGNGSFRDASAQWVDYMYPAGFDKQYGVGQISIADFNADGWPDVTLTGFDPVDFSQVVINRGQANFEKITNELGVDFGEQFKGRTIFGDIDGDGDIDVFYDSEEFQIVENTSPFEPLEFSETDLSVSISTDTSSFTAAAKVLYRMTVENTGPNSAPNINFVAGIPAIWTLDSVTPDQGACSTSFNAVTCQIGELGAGASADVSVALTLNRYPANPEIINFSAIVTSDNKDSDVGNNSASDAYTFVTTDDDNDGMPNGFEVLGGLDPQDPGDAASDLDNDGVSALDEFTLGTDPELNNLPPSQEWVLDSRHGLVSLVTDANQSLEGPFTVDYWVRLITNSRNELFDKFDGTTRDSREINVQLDCNESLINAGPKLTCSMRSLLGSLTETSAGVLMDMTPYYDRWIHLAMVFDETRHRGYFDNELLLDIPLFASFSPSPSLLKIGAEGYFAQVHLWNKALTPAEINTARSLLDGQEDGLIGYWPFDEGEGQMARDLGPHDNAFLLGAEPETDPEDPTWISMADVSAQVKNQAGISGLWYDPSLDGEGFNIVRLDRASIVFFYGYSASGERVWLISQNIFDTFSYGQVIEVQMFDSLGGTFDDPIDSKTGLREWGTLSLTFNDCGHGQFVLSGVDGDKSSSVVKLAGIEGVDCLATRFTTPVENPGGFAGLWFDPALDGEGYNIIRTGGVTVVFFYGFNAPGERLWLISEVLAGDLSFSEPSNFTMFEALGGTFAVPEPSNTALKEWGDLSMQFDDCGNGVFQLSGTDGDKTSNVVKLAGIEAMDCQN